MAHKFYFKIFYGWWIVLVTFLCTAIWSGCGSYAFSLFVRPLEEVFGWNRAGIMAAFTIMLITMGLSSPLAGRAADRYGPKKVILMGTGITGLGFVFLSSLNSHWHFYMSYLFIGIGIAAMGMVPSTMVVSKWFNEQRGLAIGIMASGFGIGGMVFAPFVGGYLIPNFGWRTAYLSLGLLTWGIVIPLVVTVIKTKPADMGLCPDGKEDQGPSHISSSSIPTPERMTLGKALFTSAFWLIAGAFFVSQFGVMGTIQSQVPHLQDMGISTTFAATALGGMGLISAFSKIAFGWLCDRIKPKYACGIGIILQAGGTLILMNIQSTSSLVIIWLYVIFFGLGMGHWLPAVSMIVSTTFGLASYGAIFGVVILFLNVGTSLGPLTAGYIYDITNSYSWAFSIFMGLYLMALLAIMGVRRPRMT